MNALEKQNKQTVTPVVNNTINITINNISVITDPKMQRQLYAE
jgi:hypothetical protein